MGLAKGSWYQDQIEEYDAGYYYYEVVFANPRAKDSLYREEFIKYTNDLEISVRKVFDELEALGVDLSSMHDVARVMNTVNGGA